MDNRALKNLKIICAKPLNSNDVIYTCVWLLTTWLLFLGNISADIVVRVPRTIVPRAIATDISWI